MDESTLLGLLLAETFALIGVIVTSILTYRGILKRIPNESVEAQASIIEANSQANASNAQALDTLQESYDKMLKNSLERDRLIEELSGKVMELTLKVNDQEQKIFRLEAEIKQEREEKQAISIREQAAEKIIEQLRAQLDDEIRRRHKIEDEKNAYIASLEKRIEDLELKLRG